MKKRICFIINPISGISKKNNLPEIILSNLNLNKFDASFQFTEYKGHAIQIAIEAVKGKADIICAVGGDGSVHEVAKGLINSSCCLAIIPCGSGNGFARHLGLPLKIEKAIDRINNGKELIADTGMLNVHHFINVCGFGFDAQIAHQFDKNPKRGFKTYARLVLKEFKNFKAQTVIIKNGNEIIEKNIFLTSVANASQFGNGFKISPQSDISDGKLELLLFRKTALRKMFMDLIKFFNGRIHQSKHSILIPFEEIELHLENNIAHVDGEPLILENNIAIIRVIPKSLKIIT